MKNKGSRRFRKLIKKHKILINLVVIFLGIILLLISFLDVPNAVSELSLEIGISVLTSGIVALFSIIALDSSDEDDTIELLSDWGIESIYYTRSEMNSHTASALPKMQEEYQQIAFGVRSLRDAYDSLFVEKAKRGVKIRFITMHPDSKFLVEREILENKQPGEMRRTIIDLIDWIKKLQKLHRHGEENIQIKFYDSIPLDFYCRIDDNLYIGPYLVYKDSQQTISYRFNSFGKGFKYYTEYFESLWNSPMMMSLKEVENDLHR